MIIKKIVLPRAFLMLFINKILPFFKKLQDDKIKIINTYYTNKKN